MGRILRDIDFWKFLTGKSAEDEKKEKQEEKKKEEKKTEDEDKEEHPITLRRF